MSIRDLLPPLREDPADARGDWGVEQADTIVYRLGLASSAVPGLPADFHVDDVQIEFIDGPIRVQRTHMRQRFGLPVVFDKCMTRIDIGDAERLALCSIETSPVPTDFDRSFSAWRERTLAAAGLVAAVLDERVVGSEAFEDAVLLSKGTFVGGLDRHGTVRTFLPFEVNLADRAALDQLSSVSVDESSTVARAARLYRRAALEGPTADAYAMLWVAAECFSEHRSPSRKDIEAALDESGLNVDGLPVSVGRLIGLRGQIQHSGVERTDELRTAFYEMEAVVRCLIRREATIHGGWFPASDNAAGFPPPFNAAVDRMHGPGRTVWHADGLPAPDPKPQPQRIPRVVPDPLNDPRVVVDPAFAELRTLVAVTVTDAIEWQEPDTQLKVRRGLPADSPPGVRVSTGRDKLWLSDDLVAGASGPDPGGELANLIWEIHAMVGLAIAKQAGVGDDEGAMTFAYAVASFGQFRRLVIHGEFVEAALQIPTGSDPASVGKLAGWTAAGCRRTASPIGELPATQRERLRSIVELLSDQQPGAPMHLLEVAQGEHPRYPDDPPTDL